MITTEDQTLSKATVGKDGVKMLFSKDVIVDGKSKAKTTEINNPEPPHPDLFLALKLLVPHFIIKAELPGFKQIDATYLKKRAVLDEPDDSDLLSFSVNGLVYSGVQGEENEAVQIIGRKILKNGQVISMALPGIKINNESNGYSYTSQLIDDIDNFTDEIQKYYSGEKRLNPDLWNQESEQH